MRYAAVLFVVTATLAQTGEEAHLADVKVLLPGSVHLHEAVYRSSLPHRLDLDGEHLLFHENSTLSVFRIANGEQLWSRSVQLCGSQSVLLFGERVYAHTWDGNELTEFKTFNHTNGEPLEPPIKMWGRALKMVRLGNELYMSNNFPRELQIEGSLHRIHSKTGLPAVSAFLLADRGAPLFHLPDNKLAVGGEVLDALTLQRQLAFEQGKFLSESSVRWFAQSVGTLCGIYGGHSSRTTVIAVDLQHGKSRWSSELPPRPGEANPGTWEDYTWGTRAGNTLVLARSWGLLGLDAASGEKLWEQHLPLNRAGFGSGGPFYQESVNKGALEHYINAQFINVEPRHFPDTMFKITVPHPYDFRIACEPFTSGTSTFVLINFRNVMPFLFLSQGLVNKNTANWTQRNCAWKTKEGQDFESADRIVLMKINALTGHPLQHQTLATGKQAAGHLISDDGKTLFIATQAGGLLRVDLKQREP